MSALIYVETTIPSFHTEKRAAINTPNSLAPSGRHIPLLTELETLFDFGFYKYAAPDGAENESQRDSNPSAQGWRSAPDRQGATTLGNRSPNSSTLKELVLAHGHQNPPPPRCNSWTRSRPLARPLRAFGFAEFLSQFPKLLKSELFSFCPFTQRSCSRLRCAATRQVAPTLG
jgi:hypothetical protein